MDDLQACYSSQGAEATVANFIMTGCMSSYLYKFVHVYDEMAFKK